MKSLVFVFLILLLTAPALAVEPQVNVQYRNGETIEYKPAGASFTLPSGWLGILPEGSNFFVIGHDTHPGMVLVTVEEAGLEEVRNVFAAPIPVDEGVTLVIEGEPEVSGKRISANFNIRSSDPSAAGAKAYGAALIGDHGFTLFAVGLGPADQLPQLTRIVQQVLRSAKLEKVKGPEPITSGPWVDRLRGQKLIRFYTGSGYSERTDLTLCADGRFFRRFDASSVSQLGTGAADFRRAGSWRIVGPNPTLVTTDSEGNVNTYSLEMKGEELHLNSNRWFREPAGC